MKILMFSMTPLFPRHSMGGAQRQLKNIALHLAEIGHEITILCTRRPDANQPFEWHERLQIIPVFRFKQPYPEPYDTPVYNIASAIQDIGEYLLKSDRYYSHDGGLIFPYVYQDIPTTISLRSILFSETLQSAFLFQGDALILPSEHTLHSYQHTVGRFFPDFKNRAKAIYNGLDWNWFKPTPANHIKELINVDVLDGHDVLLFPHRPDDAKGIRQTIDLSDLLVNTHGLKRLRILVPKWIDDKVSAGVRDYYNELRADISRRGLDEHFIFHEWIPDDLMAEYYTLGAVTLCFGSYVETFGNVPYESLGCGTPVILSRVGPARDILPEHLVDKIGYGDTPAAANIVASIIRDRRRTSEETLQYLREHFSLKKMVTQYADTILNLQKREPMAYCLSPIDHETRFILPAWCYVSPRGIYHDFRAEYNTAPEFINLIQTYPAGFTFTNAAQHPISSDMVMTWYRDGYLVPQS